ncbi:MAG: serine/threonine protein kinase [Burkholderiales bacterium RIFCSPLOWO2_02_FULL_57_36]|nr:MAG: serine/threonine protein kinase [Burkholderiales bacterium RIFCSPLOWO2_02_FULL_57_36]
MNLSYAPQNTPTHPTLNRVGRFHILRELGRGAIGSVYLGHDPVIDRQVAIKTFNPRLSPVEKKRHEQQLINEARAAGRLSHPNIVTIFDASCEGGTSYIAMEYLQGLELSKRLETGDRFIPDDVATIIWKIADALEYAHKNDVIHRDIKPANIFMVGDQPKVVDFGIARAPNRVSDKPMESEPYTLFHNNLLGTPNYMSPEQALGQSVDLRTDIYSLGAVMYEMLAGCKPFKSSDSTRLLQQIAYKNPPSPHALDAGIPIVLSHIVMKAMSKRPEKRYQHAEEMAQDIKRYLIAEKRVKRRQQQELPIPEPAKPVLRSSKGRKAFWLTCAAGLAALAILVPGLFYSF